LVGTADFVTRNRAPGVALPVGFLPAKYGRKVMAGSVSTGTFSFRNSSKL